MCRRLLPPLVVLFLLATACGGEATPGSAGSPGAVDATGGGDLQTVAAVYPLAWVAGQIAPDAEVNLLNEGGQEAHDLDISPPQRAAIETADVVLYMGDIDYQPQVEDAIPAAPGEVVSAAEVAGDDALLAASADAHAHEDEGEAHTDDEADAHADEEADAHDGEESEGHADEGTDDHADEEGGVDPHLWFDPAILAEVAVAAGEAFAAADPDNAEAYQQNAAAVSEQLTGLGDDLDDLLGGDCAFDEAIVSHAAYAYLLQPYGKTQHAVTNVSAEGDASAGELAEIVGEIREEGFTHVLAEPVEGREGAEAVANEAGVELLEISPLDAVTEEQAAAGLPDLVRAQAEAFATALGCA
ncbi:MAG: zinc ABC transporter substrate-binding protein [Euzebyaceae bacterium]|nr:zinc ABC transporter substrate-binding protein [Euzebyaceae bacterium]